MNNRTIGEKKKNWTWCSADYWTGFTALKWVKLWQPAPSRISVRRVPASHMVTVTIY